MESQTAGFVKPDRISQDLNFALRLNNELHPRTIFGNVSLAEHVALTVPHARVKGPCSVESVILC